MPIRNWLFIGLFLLAQTGQSNASDDVFIGDVPLPRTVLTQITALSNHYEAWHGFWVGRWDSEMNHILYVDSIDESGRVTAVYAIGENRRRRTKGRWFPVTGTIEHNTMKISHKRFDATYRLNGIGRLQGIFADQLGFAVLSKQKLIELHNRGLQPAWSSGSPTMVKTNLKEDGKMVSLETIIYRPPGKGPFPLAVVNHGSTGNGSDPSIFRHTWRNDWLAELLTQKGYIVAFPQRRGRGKSDGLYDEGFSAERAKGYSCDADITLAGAERALKDIRSIISALKQREDVSSAPVLLAGQSRGGILSVAYSGRYPNDVSGVVNFVGGWLGHLCPTMDKINRKLFVEGSKFSTTGLWIYGVGDSFYASTHTKANHKAYLEAGGKAKFLEVRMKNGGNGHYALYAPSLWTSELNRYLDDLDN